MVQQKYIKSRGTFKVTFSIPTKEIPSELEVESITVVGSFNEWDRSANDFSPTKKGVYKTTVEVAPNQEVQFRYLINGKHWINDWDADYYIPNALGHDNCVIIVPTKP